MINIEYDFGNIMRIRNLFFENDPKFQLCETGFSTVYCCGLGMIENTQWDPATQSGVQLDIDIINRY